MATRKKPQRFAEIVKEREHTPDPVVEALLRGPVAPEAPPVVIPEPPPMTLLPPVTLLPAVTLLPPVTLQADLTLSALALDRSPRLAAITLEHGHDNWADTSPLRFTPAQRKRGKRLVRTTVIVPAAPPPPQDEMLWVEAITYENAFDRGKLGYWTPGSSVDFDDAALSIHKIWPQERTPAIWGLGIEKETQSLTGYRDPRKEVYDEDDPPPPFDPDGWARAMNRFVELREELMDAPARMKDMPIARTGLLMHIMGWAGINPGSSRQASVADIVDLAEAQESSRRVAGLLAAAVDCVVWNRPKWLGVGGEELAGWFHDLRRQTDYLDLDKPKDNFLIWEPWGLDTAKTEATDTGRTRYALRGEYGIKHLHYVSAAGMMGDKAPWGVPGWRQCVLVGVRTPWHTCGVDCDQVDEVCLRSELPLDAQYLECSCGRPACDCDSSLDNYGSAC